MLWWFIVEYYYPNVLFITKRVTVRFLNGPYGRINIFIVNMLVPTSRWTVALIENLFSLVHENIINIAGPVRDFTYEILCKHNYRT